MAVGWPALGWPLWGVARSCSRLKPRTLWRHAGGSGTLAPAGGSGQCGRAPDRASTQGTGARPRKGGAGRHAHRAGRWRARPGTLKGAIARAPHDWRPDRARPNRSRPTEEGRPGRRARKRQRAIRTRAQPRQRAPMCPTRSAGRQCARHSPRAPSGSGVCRGGRSVGCGIFFHKKNSRRTPAAVVCVSVVSLIHQAGTRQRSSRWQLPLSVVSGS